MSLVRRMLKPALSGAAVWAGKRLMRKVQKRSAASVTSKGGRSVSRKGLSGLIFAALSAAAIAGLKFGLDRTFADRGERHNSEFDVFNDDDE